MKINISAKNYDLGEKLEQYVDKKLGKLDKHFSGEMDASVLVTKLKDTPTIEVKISAKNSLFKAEATNSSIFEAVDIVSDKLSAQISKAKGKLETRYNDKQSLKHEFDETEDEE